MKRQHTHKAPACAVKPDCLSGNVAEDNCEVEQLFTLSRWNCAVNTDEVDCFPISENSGPRFGSVFHLAIQSLKEK